MNTLSLPAVTLTITVSLCLVFTFVVFFLHEQSRRFRSADRESLLPLNEETPRVVAAADHHERESHLHDHSHPEGQCGCRTGKKAPCPGCLKRHDPNLSSVPEAWRARSTAPGP